MENNYKLKIEVKDVNGKSKFVESDIREWDKLRIFYRQREMNILPHWIITFLEDMKELHNQGEL